MTDASPATPYGQAPAPATERVGRGMLFALAAVVGAILLTIVLFEAGFLAAFSGLVVASGSVALYMKGAGTVPHRGLKSLVALIVIGAVAAILAAIFVDLWRGYDKIQHQMGSVPVSRGDFISREMTHYLFQDYGKDIAFYALFVVLGSYGTVRRLIASRRHAAAPPPMPESGA